MTPPQWVLGTPAGPMGHSLASLAGRRIGTQFCSHACAKARHNVKMLRGARIHDLLCEWRRNYKNRHKLTEIGQIVKAWLEEDEA